MIRSYELDLVIGEDCPVTVECEVQGKNYPATRTDPAEYPELVINCVLVGMNDISMCLTEKCIEGIIKDIEEKLSEEGL